MGLKVIQLDAYSKKEAIKLVNENNIGLNVAYDATRSYKEALINADFDITTFAEAKVEKTVKGAIGVGFIITLEPGIPETKTRLYEVENVLADGPRKYKVHYEIVHNNTNWSQEGDPDLASFGSFETKAEALDAAKQLVNVLKLPLDIRVLKLPIEGEAIAAHVHYKPSEDLKIGRYLVFGYTD